MTTRAPFGANNPSEDEILQIFPNWIPASLPFLSCGKSKEQFGILAPAWFSTYTIKRLCNKKYLLQIRNVKKSWRRNGKH